MPSQTTEEIIAEEQFFDMIDIINHDIDTHGRPVRDNAKIWNKIDAWKGPVGKHTWDMMSILATLSNKYDDEMEIFNQSILAQKEFAMRGRNTKYKSSDQNRMIWKTLMTAKDVWTKSIWQD